jgi:SnoaL-like domain
MVRTVFARVRDRDPSVSDLYADDATIRSADGLHQGRQEIVRFYERVRAPGVQPQIEDLFVNLPLVVAVLNVTTSDGQVVRVADVFEVGEDAIRSLQICHQEPRGTGP